ncbi:InlB B-repeat-containing protein [Demequina sediminicola]|uniref:InlB B-repeat-containing protein n=1 Tax=Demequina sediminicola TaxID=1095026 RepID=UPI0007858CA4|nr:InlB B-repeat-containing protein [Demequina sediminicola]
MLVGQRGLSVAVLIALFSAVLVSVAPAARAAEIGGGLSGQCFEDPTSGDIDGYIQGSADVTGSEDTSVSVPASFNDGVRTCDTYWVEPYALRDKGITDLTVAAGDIQFASGAASGNPLETFTIGTGAKVTASAVAPYRYGWDFNGWTSTPGGTTPTAWASPAAETKTYYAMWSRTQFTMRFDFRDGGVTPTQSAQYAYETSYLDISFPAIPAREHFTSQGWYTTTNPSFPAQSGGKVYGNADFHVKWDAAEYTTTFDSNGGSAVAPQTLDYPGVLTEPAPTREHYTLMGWKTTGGDWWDFADAPESDMTLTAQWEVNQYPVTFDSNGGSAVSPQSVTYLDTATEPSDPAREHYAFTGWYDGASLWDFDTQITGPVGLTAHWDPNVYAVTFDSAGGSAVASEDVTYPGTASEPTAPTRSEYVFAGWEDPSGDPWSFGTTVTEDVELTATWESAHVNDTYFTYTVDPLTDSFTVTGLTPAGETQSHLSLPWKVEVAGHTFTLRSIADGIFENSDAIEDVALPQGASIVISDLDLGTPVRMHYTFDDWAVTLGGVRTRDLSTLHGGGVVWHDVYGTNESLVPYFTPNTYTVTYDSTHGSAVPSEDVTYPATAAAPTDPSSEHYTFAGWLDSAGQPWSFSTTVTSNMTLTAAWAPLTYTVTFDPANGDAVESVEATYPSPAAPASAPFKSGYTFSHWTDNADSTWDTTATVTADAALTAVYTENERMVAGPQSALPGETITIAGRGFDPGESVEVELHSTPVLLASTTADASGAFSIEVTIPEDISPGEHTLVLAAGTGTAEMPFTVTAPTVMAQAGEMLAATGAQAWRSTAVVAFAVFLLGLALAWRGRRIAGI